ncbi:PAS domain-containing sensor histidine kinase [Crenalkalicoccus roseus]|uniref:PAS domain-containing sensor histidine kinase n=1 Tax=Crenalkalicoccus roseus TaxID=1485588 RepID=UPI00108076AD|nr:PAS domain S-box protein [Crenalkalicoccus roseus]
MTSRPEPLSTAPHTSPEATGVAAPRRAAREIPWPLWGVLPAAALLPLGMAAGWPAALGLAAALSLPLLLLLRGWRAAAGGEARFRAMADTVPALVWMTDPEGRLIFANRRYEEMFGRPVAAMLGHGWRDIVLPEDVEAAVAAFRAAAARRRPFRHELRVRDAAGAVRWLRCEADPWHGPGGEFAGYVGCNVDITEARAAEAALRASEARQRALFESAPFAVIVIDPATHRILEVNDRACLDYGYTREEFTRLSIADIDALGDSAAIRSRGRAHAVGPDAQEFEARHRLKSGALRDVLVRVQGVRIGGQDVTYGAHFDITDRKAAEAALRASETRLRLAIEAAEFGTWEYDVRRDLGRRAGRLADALPALPPEGFGLAAWLAPIHPEDRPRAEAALREVLEGRSPRFEAEFRLPAPDGGWRWVASRGAVVERDEATGAPLLVAGVARDVTARREAEERQALLTRELDHRARNALAVVQAALRLTPREDPEAFARTVEGRVAALARAHTLLARGNWRGVELRALVEGALTPFLSPQGGPRAVLEGPALLLSPGAAQALSMAFHELATNAAKHGALSSHSGQVAICWEVLPGQEGEEVLSLAWAETGGPPVAAPPRRRGFGSSVLQATVGRQLGGSIALRWRPEGLLWQAMVPMRRIRGAVEEEPALSAPAGEVPPRQSVTQA